MGAENGLTAVAEGAVVDCCCCCWVLEVDGGDVGDEGDGTYERCE